MQRTAHHVGGWCVRNAGRGLAGGILVLAVGVDQGSRVDCLRTRRHGTFCFCVA